MYICSSSSSGAVPAQPRTPKLLNDVVGKLHGGTLRVANTRKAARTIVRSTIWFPGWVSEGEINNFCLERKVQTLLQVGSRWICH